MHVDESLWHEVLAEEGALDERIRSAVSGVTEERERLMNARIQAASAVATFDARIVKCNRILKAAGALEAEASTNGSRRKRRDHSRPGQERLEVIFNAIKARPDGGTIAEISQDTDLHKSTVSAALAVLREDNRIRAAGKRPSRAGIPPEVFKVMDNG